MKRRPTPAAINSHRLTDHCQQLTNPIIALGLPPIADFSGAGRRRSEAKSAIVEEQDRQDLKAAERVERLGVNPHQSAAEISIVDILTEGAIFENRGRQLRQLPIFHASARAKQGEAWAVLAAWRHRNPGVRIIHIRARLKDGAGQVPVHRLREAHLAFSGGLGEHFAYGCKAAGAVGLAVGRHHKPLQSGWLIDIHTHLAAALLPGADVDRLQEYMAERYDCFFEIIDGEIGASGLASYLRHNTARHISEVEDEYLVEYVKQTEKLRFFEFLGPAKSLKAELDKAGYRAVVHEDDGGRDHVFAEPIRRRNPSYKPTLTRQAGQRICAVRLAWIDGELRPALIVSGWRGDWADLRDRYNLDAAIAEARKAWAHTYTCNNVTPESSPPANHQIDSSPPTSCRIGGRQDGNADP